MTEKRRADDWPWAMKMTILQKPMRINQRENQAYIPGYKEVRDLIKLCSIFVPIPFNRNELANMFYERNCF